MRAQQRLPPLYNSRAMANGPPNDTAGGSTGTPSWRRALISCSGTSRTVRAVAAAAPATSTRGCNPANAACGSASEQSRSHPYTTPKTANCVLRKSAEPSSGGASPAYRARTPPVASVKRAAASAPPRADAGNACMRVLIVSSGCAARGLARPKTTPQTRPRMPSAEALPLPDTPDVPADITTSFRPFAKLRAEFGHWLRSAIIINELWNNVADEFDGRNYNDPLFKDACPKKDPSPTMHEE